MTLAQWRARMRKVHGVTQAQVETELVEIRRRVADTPHSELLAAYRAAFVERERQYRWRAADRRER